ncbi:Uncharacterised protein [Legionella donaldsonii]|uniref:Uncharacterized protein n=1 Tax=Legionella donaldsonii TaxID=45060 RepID=A0A378KN73_9GAMM|nr:hypothetical protein [Legionella donaldsonii]STX84921.1 Uncharacterised protein [Legionella donaldsonii]
MRDNKINVIYYPDMFVSETTLKKAILFFDEIHFMDRPSLTINNIGTIGATSPLRQYEESFRDAGVPLFVHGVQGGRITGDLLDQVYSDINDLLFLNRFKDGLRTSLTFRNLQIPAGNYGNAGNEVDVFHKVEHVDLACLEEQGAASALLIDNTIKPFDLSSPRGCTKQLVYMAALCSAQMNFALKEGAKNGFIPLADATPYGNLLSARYTRAAHKLDTNKNHIQVTDLSFAIFDQLIPTECIEKLSIQEVVKYRKTSENARKDFLEYLSLLQTKQHSIIVDNDYLGAIDNLITTEIIPAARNYRNKLITINEAFSGSLAKGVITGLGGSNVIQILTELSLEKILLLGGAVGAYVLKAAVDEILAKRAIKRESTISYILSLDK